MLRAEMQDTEKVLTVRLEGRFSGDAAEHVRTQLMHSNGDKGLVVDLTEVTFIDLVGEATLSFFRRLGAKFVAHDAYVLDICKRLNLPMARNHESKQAAGLVKRPTNHDHG